MPIDPEYAMHCIKCKATGQLIMFAHRIEGQMVGWVFACKDCWPMVTGAQLEIIFHPSEVDDASGDNLLLPR